MKLWIGAAVAVAGVALFSGCATMNEDQCLVGDWGGRGWQDGAQGRRLSRLEVHAKACAKYGVAPNMDAYLSAREDGLRTYCTWENGFRQGREGNSYGGVCTLAEEAEFVPAYQDGRAIYTAEQAVGTAERALNSALSWIASREDKLEAKQRELRQAGLSDEERSRIRDRIQEVRQELADARRDLRRAEEALSVANSEAGAVRSAIGARYGVW